MKTRRRRLVLLGPLVLGLASLSQAAHLELSPGALSRAHRDLGGSVVCLACHEGGDRTMTDLCRSCHREIEWLVTARRGLHGRGDLGECASCHTEHAGRDASPRAFSETDISQFDHQRTGWILEGRHAEVGCSECHKAGFQHSEAARLSRRENRDDSFIGLETGCGNCHQNVHRKPLGEECVQCHNPAGWSVVADDFDHARAGFALTGRHSGLACLKCHPEGPAGMARFVVRRPRNECSDCHRDVHRGRAGPRCSGCHVTDGFWRTNQAPFDHDRTGFPLVGEHLGVRCEQCHRQSSGGRGWLVRLAMTGAGCRACHASAHGAARTEFPLSGKHLEVRCEGCHRQDSEGPALDLEGARESCTACHTDAHAGQIQKLQVDAECVSCHRVEGWQAVTFTTQEHAATGFSLQGRHAVVGCVDCHGAEKKGPELSRPIEALGQARIAFDLGGPGCQGCHSGPHGGRFSPGGDSAREQSCAACHGVESFRPSLVDPEAHQDFDFPLNGRHATTSCDRCHGEIRREAAGPEPELAPPAQGSMLFAAAGSCESCHQDKSPHGTQFSRLDDGGDCARCHGESAFKPAERFDHDRGTLFPLLGSHSDIECDQCHFEKRTRRARSGVVIYRGTPNGCSDCHRKGVPAMITSW